MSAASGCRPHTAQPPSRAAASTPPPVSAARQERSENWAFWVREQGNNSASFVFPPKKCFISIDCGYTTNSNYTDSRTGITYASDARFTDAGLVHAVDPQNLQTDLAARYLNLRFFPSGIRNCYTLQPLTPGGKYLVRAIFGYGDYDKLNRLPTFDLYFGVKYWTTVTIVNSSTAYVFEIIALSPADFLQICLVDIGLGTPFISGLDLRSLTSDLYPEANVTQSLVLLSFFRETVGFGPNRYHFGTNYQHIRFPDDPYDRMWQRYEDIPSWTDLPNKSNGTIQNSLNDTYDAPSAVIRSASTPLNASRMDLSWSSDSSMCVGVDPKYFLVLYFAELEAVQELRQFDVSVDNNQLASAFSPQYLVVTVLSEIVQGSNEHSVSLVATSNSSLPPLISAMEIYMVRPMNSTRPNLCGNHTYNLIPNKKKDKTKLILEIVLPAIAAIALMFVALLVIVILPGRTNKPDMVHSASPFENRRFTYKEHKRITNNFDTVIGRGGFGLVYVGSLQNGTPVAVKIRSETSSQGNTEFLAEAQHLARVHHRNLVSLIGYCKDKKHLSLVYEYMDGGNLQDRLGGHEPLNWLQCLKIALDSAYGLEYLHKSCSPPLIHRDVKAMNTLLTANLEAKLSDFGLTRAFSSVTRTHTTIQPAGTLGYLDPEYYATSHLSEKSDVYSFGVVLLVLITAQPAIITISDTERSNIAVWARDRLSEGDIESLTDPKIRGDCDINSVWKVANLALQCTKHEGRDRPTMTEVVEGISESLLLETSSHSTRSSSVGTGGSALADADSVGALEAAELIGETSAR